ncbi:hypothetical protein HYW46_06760 [Candidatus Daviesbacteria bacterium]|nr:hypothetical protein [Candidatus Daviesbacteria bacterium]
MRSKVLSVLAVGAAVLLNPISVFAQDDVRNIGSIAPSASGLTGINPSTTSLGDLIRNALVIIYILAAVAVLAMLVFGAFQWITSGGDKEAVQKARSRITAALVGMGILALALFITVLMGQILNINVLNLPTLPTLGNP